MVGVENRNRAILFNPTAPTKSSRIRAVPQAATQQPHSMQRLVDFRGWPMRLEPDKSTSASFMCTRIADSLIARIHLRVDGEIGDQLEHRQWRERDPLSGSASTCGRREPGRPSITIAQLPQIPARQTKSNAATRLAFRGFH
jgi:hypothetical protein